MKTDLLLRLGWNTGLAACVAAGLFTAHCAQGQTYGEGNMGSTGCTATGTSGGCTNSYIGSASGAATQGNALHNTFVGSTSGTASTTCTASTFVGSDCGASNTTGSENAFTGKSSGRSNITADYNTFMGAYSAYSNTNLSANDAFGWKALYTQAYNPGTPFGSYNVAIGSLSLFTNNPTSSANGIMNTALGNSALYSNTTGFENLGCGYQAGYSNTTGQKNVFLGPAAGYYTQTGNYNTVAGYQAGQGAISNSYTGNSFFGYKAGNANTTGGSAVFIGFQAGLVNTSGSYNTFVGYNSGKSNTLGTRSTFVGQQSGFNSTGSNNTFLGWNAGATNTTGANNTCVGYGANVTSGALSNATALGNGAIVLNSNTMYFGNAAVTTCINTANSWTSDGRFKFNVTENVKGLDFIKKLRPITYQMDAQKLDDHYTQNMPDSLRTLHKQVLDFAPATNLIHSGFIAQEVEQAANECGFTSSIVYKPAHSTDAYALSYAELVVPLVKAVQELSNKVDSLTATTQEQSAIINSMKDGSNQQMNLDNGSGLDNVGSKTKVEEMKLVLPENSMIGDAYPNPNSGSTQIQYFVPENTIGAKAIFMDMLGRVLEVRELQAGYGQLNLNMKGLPTGTYSYSLEVDGKVLDSKKIIKN